LILKAGRAVTSSAKLAELNKIRVGIVNYLNTRPLIYGLERLPIRERIELIGDYPSRLVDLLRDGKIDVGLIPVAAIPTLPGYHIVGHHCIGAEGEIASVALFSDVPMEEIREVLLDYQSRSSVALLKWLMKESWGISPIITEATDDSYRVRIKGTTAGLVIGDRAFEQRKISNYIYDLGSEWRAITGLPFVFAAWVSLKSLSADFIIEFDEANELGLFHLDEIAAAISTDLYDMEKYYKLHLSYRLDEKKKKGLDYFLDEAFPDIQQKPIRPTV
jgi:chorismate dehydratase